MNNIDNSNSTVFRCSLDENLDITKNNIYSITLLLAWGQVQNELETKELIIDNIKLSRLNNYKVGSVPLTESEYNKEVFREEDSFTIKVNFEKNITFYASIRNQ